MTDKPTAAAWRMLVLLTGAVILSMTTWFSATAILPQLTAQWQLSGLAQTWMTNGVQLRFVAGALGLRLAGPRVYGETRVEDHWMGDGRTEANAADIRRALTLYKRSCTLLWASAALLAAVTLL